MFKNKYIKNLVKVFIFIFVITIYNCVSYAAPASNLPTKVTQPNGEELNLFASGDEYFNYLHDENGNIVIKNYDTGYYTYAQISGTNVVASDIIVTNISLIDEDYEYYTPITFEDIPKEYIKTVYENSPLNNTFQGANERSLINTSERHPFLNETINNIVIFIEFNENCNGECSINGQRRCNPESDNNKFEPTHDANHYNSILNTDAESLKAWFDTASYGKTEVISHMYQVNENNLIVPYVDDYCRSVYVPININGNNVYILNGEEIGQKELEHDLLERAINAVSDQIPANIDLDVDQNGEVDCITFIVAGDHVHNTLFWSHKSDIWRDVNINGKSIKNYVFIVENATSNASTLQHEIFHMYGAPDLYRYIDGYPTIVGDWDIMSSSEGQMTCNYMKYKYGNWINEIPEIKDDTQTYTINKNTLPTNNSYILRSPYSWNEFFVVEYRKKEAPFEDAISGSGIVIFRIDSLCMGNSKYNGTTLFDEVYVDEVPKVYTDSYYYNNSQEVSLFLRDGTDAGIKLSNFVLSGDTASFDVEFSYDKILDYFLDKRIVEEIRYTLNKSIENITAEDLHNLTTLWIPETGKNSLSVNLSGIEQLKNLKTLIVNNCKVEDISALSALINLEHLELNNNNIEDFSPLQDLTSLKVLKLRGNVSSDYSSTEKYYDELIEKDFSLDNMNDIIFCAQNFDSNNIWQLYIICSETIPKKIHIIAQKFSQNGELIFKLNHQNFNLYNGATLSLSDNFNCSDGSYVVIRAYERGNFTKQISKCTIKPVSINFE